MITLCFALPTSTRNLGFIFDSHLTFCDQISSVHMSWQDICTEEICDHEDHEFCREYTRQSCVFSTKFVIFVASDLFSTLILLAPLAHLLFTPGLTTAIPCTTVFQVKSRSTHPACYCSCCFCSFQVLQPLSYSHISALAQGTGTHWMQSYFY